MYCVCNKTVIIIIIIRIIRIIIIIIKDKQHARVMNMKPTDSFLCQRVSHQFVCYFWVITHHLYVACVNSQC